MKYAHKFAEVQSEGLGETEGFKIATSGKAFRSLIDSIYSRKIESPIRELLTNAYDAHIAAGKIEPFHLHLPTPMFPTFFVRDFGPSMSHEFVKDRYTTLFESTKDGAVAEDAAAIDPDSQVGSWGLGSKTPFTYTDAFTLTCWMNSEVRVYHIFMGANGQPQCALAHRGPSDEPTGVKVEFPVKEKDHEEFEETAVRVLKGFHILPTGLSPELVKKIEQEPEIVGSFFKVYSPSYLGQGFFARQGCVIYPINMDEVEHEDASKLAGVSASIVIDFPIGSVEYTNSREYLSYTPKTLASLDDAIERFKAEVGADVRKQLQGIKNPFERAAAVGRSDLFTINRFTFLSEVHKQRDEIGRAFRRMIPYRRGDFGHAKYAINSHGEKAHIRRWTFVPDGSFPNRVALIYLDETTKKGTPKTTIQSGRVSDWLNNNDLGFAYVLDRLPPLSELRKMGFPPITRASSIPQLPKEPRQYTHSGGGFSRYFIDESTIPDDALFVFVNRGQQIDPEFNLLPPSKWAEFRQAADILGRQIVSVNTRRNEKLDKLMEGREFVYDLSMTSVLDGLADEQIEALIAVINCYRFDEQSISEVYKTLDSAGVAHLTPLVSLGRFEKAKKKAERLHGDLIDIMSKTLSNSTRDDDDTVNWIIERGRALGLEVLMPNKRVNFRRAGSGYYHRDTISLDPSFAPKIPPMFHDLIQFNNLNDAEVAYITKEVFQ